MLKVSTCCVLVVLASACGGGTAEGPDTSEAGPSSELPQSATIDLVILSDSLSLGEWPHGWAELMERDLGSGVELHDLSVAGKADYDVLLERVDVRDAVRDAEVVFISPDPDYLRDACPPGTSSPDCVTEFTAEYRARWSDWLDDIAALSEGAVVRSADAWIWLAPTGNRDGLSRFMAAMASETVAHGGLVADINRALTGEALDQDPPPDSIDSTGHLTGSGAETMAELLHELGYAGLE